MSGKRSSGYVKDNDVHYGLKVAYHDPKSSKVTGLQCHFCIAFGWEEKVGSKCKAATTIQGWSHPFHYDNIENHLHNQHSGQWALYQALESSFERASFFDDIPVAFKNSIKVHFLSLSLGVKQQIVYDIEKDIMDTIMGDMMFNLENQVDSDADHDTDEEPAFGSAVEINALLLWRCQAASKAKERALLLFKHVELEDDAAIYSYSVTIPKTKTTLFRLAMCYVSCGTSFRMASELIGCMYDVLGNPGLCACSRDEINNFIRVVYAVNLQQIADLLHRSWAFSLALDSTTHQSTSFFDLHFRVFIPNYHSIVNLHGCALRMFDRHTGDIMSTMVSKFLTVLCPNWTIHLLGLTSDEARNMIGWVAGVVIRLDAAMHSDCSLIWI